MGKTGKGGECMEAYAAYRVLMVEDDRGIAQAVQTQGELWNLQVRQVRDLRHVMEEFAEFDPHLVLLYHQALRSKRADGQDPGPAAPDL